MKRAFTILFFTTILIPCLPAPEAFAQPGSVKVIVKVRFMNRVTGKYYRNSQHEPVEISPTKIRVHFKGDTDKTTPRLEIEPGASFFTLRALAGEYQYFILTPDKSYVSEPPPEAQDQLKSCPRELNCPKIKVRKDHFNDSASIVITFWSKAEGLVLRRTQGPEIDIILERIMPARYQQGIDIAGVETEQKETGQRTSIKELKGKLINTGNQALDGALVQVSVYDTGSQELKALSRAETDALGQYLIRLSQDQKHANVFLDVSKNGYEPESFLLAWDEVPPPTIVLKRVSSSNASAPKTGGEDDENLFLPPMEAIRRYTFSSRIMQALPVSGNRSFDAFALLAPGVLLPPQTFGTAGPGVSSGVGTAGQFSVNGMRSRENNFTVDGSDNNDEDIGTRRQGFLSLTPQPIETLQEFQIITALADANYGRNTGGQVDALTQSGTPNFHGSFYGFFTDNRLNARDFFDHSTQGGPSARTLTRASDNVPVLLDNRPLVMANPVADENPLKRTQAGLLVGGRVSPTDTSYFGAFERKVNRESTESHFAVPTVKQRGVFDTGDSGLRLGGAPIFPSSIPGDAIFSLYPLPNNPLGPYRENTYTAVLPANADATLFTVKINQRFGDPDQKKKRTWWRYLPIPRDGDLLTGRYNFTQDRNQIPVTGGALFSSLRPRVRTQNVAFFLNRRFSDRTFDTIRFSFGRTRLFFLGTANPPILSSAALPKVPFLLNAPLLLNVTAPNAIGSPNPPAFVSASSPQGTTLLNSLGYASVTQTEQITGPLGQVLIPGFSPVGIDVLNFPQTRANNTIQIADTLRHIRGNHAYTFGSDVRKTQINSTLERNFRPIAQYGSLRNTGVPLALTQADGSPLTQQVFTGATLAAAGVPTGLFHTIGIVPDSTIGIRFTQVNFFAQDEWSARPNLRLTMGIRYEVNTVPDTVGQRLEKTFDPALIREQAQAAAAQCQPRCNDLVAGLTSVFPADFKLSFGADRNDLDVRLGFAYDVGQLGKPYDASKAGRMVIRGGVGTYSGQFPGIVLSQSRNAFPSFVPVNLANFSGRLGNRAFLFNPANPNLQPPNGPLSLIVPGTLNTFQGNNTVSLLAGQLLNLQALSLAPTTLGLDLVLPQRELKTSYAIQYGIIAENQILEDYYLSVSFVGTRGIKLLRLSTPDLGTNNSQVNFTGVGSLGASSVPFFSGSELPAQQSIISGSFAVARTLFESSASSTYNSLQLELRRRYVRNFQLGSALTYSHSLDDASDFFDTAGGFALPQNSARRSERASSSFDARWRWVSHFLYDISRDFPLLKSKLGGWRVSGILTSQTGQPFTINSAFDVNRDGNLTDRLNSTNGLIISPVPGDNSIRLGVAPGVDRLSLLASERSDGALGRNTFRAPGIFDFDLSITKNLNFSDKHRLYFRTEIFNLFNRAHFAVPDRILESPGFGRAVRTTIPARVIQLAFKYSF